MKNKKVLMIARTGILLALTIMFQYFGRFIPLGPNSNFIVGPLVNACLLVSAVTVGIWGGLVISVVAPFFAALTANPAMFTFIMSMAPFIAAGNFVLVLMFYLFKAEKRLVGLGVGAILKFIVIRSGLILISSLLEVPEKMRQVLGFMFGWPQIVTAIIGGVIAFIALRVLRKLPN